MSRHPDEPTLLIDFLNTLDVEAGIDTLDDRDAFVEWARSRGFEAGDRGVARRVRDALRASVQGRPVDLSGLNIPVRIGDGCRPLLAPADIAGAAMAAAIGLAQTDRWNRVKLCPADDCLEAFFDDSRNRSRVWCDMADCGNLAKVRNYRARIPS